MKNILNLLFLLIITSAYSQTKPKDTIRKEPDCTRYIKERQEKFEQFIKEKQTTDYKNLTKLIIENIDTFKIPSKNLIVFVDYRETRPAILPEDLYECLSSHNLTNPAYNERDFWRKNTFETLKEKFKKNLIVKKIENYLSGNNIINFINTKNKISPNSYYYYFLSLNRSVTKDNEEFFYLPYEYVTMIDPNDSNSILIKFKNYLGGKVDVEIFYNYNTDQLSLQKLSFQYQNNDWKLIK